MTKIMTDGAARLSPGSGQTISVFMPVAASPVRVG